MRLTPPLLFVTGSPNFAQLVCRDFFQKGYDVNYEVLDSAAAVRQAIAGRTGSNTDDLWGTVIVDDAVSLDVLRILREGGQEVPVIALCDVESEEAVLPLIEGGASDCIPRNSLTRLYVAVRREQRAREMRHHEREEREAQSATDHYLASMVQAADEAIISMDEQRRICHYNQGAEKMFGYSASEAVGQSFDMLLPERLQAAHRQQFQEFAGNSMTAVRLSGDSLSLAQRKDGSVFPAEASVVKVAAPGGMRYTTILRDVTERFRTQERLHQLAYYDQLTGLPNRGLFIERLQHALARRLGADQRVVVIILDLDRFKDINDFAGHNMGDRLLQAVPERIRKILRKGDTVARLGGDEFAVLLDPVTKAEALPGIAKKLCDVFAPPFVINGHELYVTASIGISQHPDDSGDADALMRYADVAIDRAKEQGRNNFHFYAADMSAKATRRLSLEAGLRRALEREEFVLHYQFQASLISGQIIGAESLIRWNCPGEGMVSPVNFIPLLEETGLIIPVGEWVLATACAQNHAWQRAGPPEICIGVNLSPRQFAQRNLPGCVERILRETGLAPSCLDVEITEGMIVRDTDQAIRTLQELKNMGVRLSVDDFGTGYSSLSYLKRMPLHTVKIDRSFVTDVTTDPDSAAIVRSIIAMSHSMKRTVIAEGVETAAQAAFLARQRCEAMQGYYFSKPIPADMAQAALAEGRQLDLPDVLAQASARTLLLLDDEANVIAALRRLLRQDGYSILTASNAAQAFDQLANYNVGVFLADQRMPGMSGADVLCRVKDMYPETIRIVLSGCVELQSLTDAVNKGAVYKFLTKPWNDEVLRGTIREAFRYHELLRAGMRSRSKSGLYDDAVNVEQ